MARTGHIHLTRWTTINADIPLARPTPTYFAETKEKMVIGTTASITPPLSMTEAQKHSSESGLQQSPLKTVVLSGESGYPTPLELFPELRDAPQNTENQTAATTERDRTGESFQYRHDIYSKPELTAADLDELYTGGKVLSSFEYPALAPPPARVRPTFDRASRVPIHVSHYPGSKKAEMSIVVTTEFHDGGNPDTICIPIELGITEALYMKRGLDEFISEYVRRYACND